MYRFQARTVRMVYECMVYERSGLVERPGHIPLLKASTRCLNAADLGLISRPWFATIFAICNSRLRLRHAINRTKSHEAKSISCAWLACVHLISFLAAQGAYILLIFTGDPSIMWHVFWRALGFRDSQLYFLHCSYDLIRCLMVLLCEWVYMYIIK